MRNLSFILITLIIAACSVKPVTKLTEYHTTVLGDAHFPAVLSSAKSSEPVSKQIENPEPKLDDLWKRIHEGFALADIEHPRIQRELNWYARHPEYMQRVAERAKPYLYHIVEAIEQRGIPSEIALLPIVESAFQPFAYSHGRASGIWQFIPATGRRYGLKQNWWYDGRRDIYASTLAALKLLDHLQTQFNGDWMLALAAYNSGAGTVKKAILRNKRRGKAIDFWSLKLPRETRAYVPKLLALKKLLAEHETYEVNFEPIPNEPYFRRVEVDSQIDLAKVAELAELELDHVYQLNPGFNRWATPPNGPNHLLLPIDKAEPFLARLEDVPAQQRIRWLRHRIRSGETLSTIAQKYNTSTRTIKKLNRIRGNRLRTGRHLTIPVASKQPHDYRLSAAQRKNTLQNTPRKGVKVTHIVRAGDTFWELAQRHHVNVRLLAKWNAMAPRDPLMPGQKLVIWSRASKHVSSNTMDDLVIPPRRSITKRIGYRVRRGDSLSRISQKFRVSISQLRRWNRLPSNNILHPGQRLTLYVDVTKQSS